MWPKKSKPQEQTFAFVGEPRALTGHTATYAIESLASDAIVLHAVPDFAELCDAMGTPAPAADDPQLKDNLIICQQDQLGALAAKTSGFALTGLRSVAITSSLAGMHESLYAMAGKRLACVINLTCRALPRQSAALHGGHDDYYAAAAAGFVQLFASNVQQVADFSLIAHRIAELSLTPVICAQDFYDTSHSLQNVYLPGQQLISKYLGRSEDSISSPTPAQVLLYGEQRRRIPVLVDRDHPAGIGGVQDRDSYFRAVAAQRAYFYDHCEALVDLAMQEYGELTGRFYNKVAGYLHDDAEVLVVAQGAVTEELRASVDYLRKQEKIKAGIVNINVLRPFPGAQLTHMLKGKKAVTVLERTDQPLAEDLPLMQEIRCAIDRALENGQANSPPYPGHETYHKLADRPQLFSAIYGIGCEIPSARELLAVYRNMRAADGGKRCFYLDVNFGQADRRFPYLQTLQQSLNKDYPQLQQLSLSTVDMPVIPAQGAQSIQIHSLSSQGGLFAGNIFRNAADQLTEVLQHLFGQL